MVFGFFFFFHFHLFHWWCWKGNEFVSMRMRLSNGIAKMTRIEQFGMMEFSSISALSNYIRANNCSSCRCTSMSSIRRLILCLIATQIHEISAYSTQMQLPWKCRLVACADQLFGTPRWGKLSLNLSKYKWTNEQRAMCDQPLSTLSNAINTRYYYYYHCYYYYYYSSRDWVHTAQIDFNIILFNTIIKRHYYKLTQAIWFINIGNQICILHISHKSHNGACRAHTAHGIHTQWTTTIWPGK